MNRTRDKVKHKNPDDRLLNTAQHRSAYHFSALRSQPTIPDLATAILLGATREITARKAKEAQDAGEISTSLLASLPGRGRGRGRTSARSRGRGLGQMGVVPVGHQSHISVAGPSSPLLSPMEEV